jgi:hypothetical protein
MGFLQVFAKVDFHCKHIVIIGDLQFSALRLIIWFLP